MGKKSKSKAGGDFWDEDPELADQPEAEEFGGTAAESEPQTEPANEPANEPEQDGLLAALQRSKLKKGKRDEEAEAAAEASKTDGVVQVKSKKEKEREKKEREKAKKKAAAARKAASQPQKPKAAKAESTEPEDGATPEPDADAADADADADADAADEDAAVDSAAAAKAAAAGGKSKGKKKLNPVLAALQKKQAEKEAAERAKAEKAAAAARADEEKARRLAEEEAAEEEARRLKRERKKQRDEQLKKEGKYMTKRQKEQAAQMARRREQMLASGALVGGVLQKDKKDREDSRSATPEVAKQAEPKKQASPVQEKPAAKPAAKPNAPAPAPAPAAEPAASSEPKKADAAKSTDQDKDNDEDGALLSDWEAGLSDSDSAEHDDNTDKQSTEEPRTPESDAAGAKSDSHDKHGGAHKEETANELLHHKADAKKRAELESKRDARHKKAVAEASESNLRSPICAILGHVDTGKTKLLDNMRKTNVQAGEAGGITQQIGATYFPIDMIKKKTETMENHVKPQYNVPGLLIIDTPGHESFTNLRSRGSSLCNIAILVVDITHGLEPQTLESIRLLRDRKTPFVVALNKVDRLYGWESTPNNNFRDALAAQDEGTQRRFEDRLEITKVLLAEQGFNSELYYKNKNLSRYVSIVPTSAVSGEGVPDLLYLLLELTQSRMSKQLMYLSELEATILEVKVVEGLGTTIDVVLSNGILHEGDRVVLCGNNGPIATNVRALLTPQPARELRIKSQYVHHKEVKAALGVKISANDLEHAIAGSRLLRVGPNDNEEDLKDDVMDDMSGLLDSVDKSGEGVCVQASTLGSLEALLDFLKDMKIPVMSIGLGPVFKRDVMRATTMLDRRRELALMLCFDVKVDKEAEHYANEQGIKIFTADIIYHLFDEFKKYQEQLLEQRRRDTIHDAVFPCVLKTIQVINKRNPMIIGVDVVEGSARIGTPIVIVKADPTTGQKLTYPLGRIQSMEVDHKPRDVVRKGQANAGVAVRLDAGNMTHMPTWGRQIEEKDPLYSLVSRKSIDVLKDPAFRNDVAREDWLLLKKLKPIFDIK